jgi:hypothetical protein
MQLLKILNFTYILTVQGSGLPWRNIMNLLHMGYWFFKHFTSNTKFAMPGLGQGLGKRLKLDP